MTVGEVNGLHRLIATQFLDLKGSTVQPAGESRKDTSGGADSRKKGMRRRTLASATLSCS